MTDFDGTDFSDSAKHVTTSLREMNLATGMTVASTLSRQGRSKALRTETWAAVPQWLVVDAKSEVGVSPAPDLVLAARLGQGGMGVVESATQTALGREVAVKRLRTSPDNAESRDALLREACLTGGLEHPNIIPIHAVGSTDAHGPIVVMKRIYGQPWHEILDVDRTGSLEERLDKHMRIFLQVGHAIEFAHSRGVIHRDIKPENVMVGSYGEVVLVDWGVAATLEGLADGSETGIAGTPAYMPPEQAAGAAEHTGTQSDIYLLGAVLFELVTGHPPRHNTTIAGALMDALKRPLPSLEGSCPDDLAAIIAKACAYAPAHRYASVAELLDAVKRFIDRRPLGRLLTGAEDALAKLHEAQVPEEQKDQRGVYQSAVNAFAQVRFAHVQAKAGWPDDPSPDEVLNKALHRMVQLEVAFGHPDSAEALLLELDSDDAALVDAVEALRRAKEADAAELEGRRRDDDLDSGRSLRIFFATSLCVVALAILVYLSATSESFTVNRQDLFVISVSFGALVFGFFAVTRKRLFATRVDRQMALTVMLFTFAIVIHRGAAWFHDIAISWIMTTELLLLATLFALLTPFHRHAALSTLITMLALAASIADPPWALPLYSAVSPVCIGIMAYGWRSSPQAY